MKLIKEKWEEKDIEEFQNYLKSFSKGKEKGIWEQRIINTKLPCIAVPAPIIKQIAKEIAKGNFLSFLDLWIWENFSNTAINGSLICQIKNFDLMTKYLKKYVNKIDNWASCDTLKFKINEKNKKEFFKLSKDLINANKPFVRRVGLVILFKYLDDEIYIDDIFELFNNFENEKEYYVNMIVAWLVAECFVKQREKTIKLLSNHKLNKFTINKAISKCRDSFRVSNEDKEMLLKFKIK